jgi:dTDP-4-dehydrorhamnose reductase
MRWRPRRKRLMFVTGATGFLGRHLVDASERGDWELLAPSSRNLDIRDAARVHEEINSWRPNVVVHLAYRKGDRRNIVDGSAAVAKAASAANARLIHVSTDVVFAGRDAPYTESDLPDPIIQYGQDKADAEQAVQIEHPSAVILRPSLLYGTDRLGWCQVDVERALSGQQAMQFFTDEIRNPVHAADVADAITSLADRTDVSGPLHVAGPQAISRADFARRIARQLQLDPERVATASIAESGLVRPGVIVLDSSRATALGLHLRGVDECLGA